MSLFSTIKGWFSPQGPVPKSSSFKARLPHTSGRARLTVNKLNDLPFSSTLFIIPPPDAETLWRTETLDSTTLDRISPADLTKLLIDLSPEISRAAFDYIRMFNPGWELKGFRPGTEEEDPTGQAALDAILLTLRELYVSEDVVFNRLVLAAYIRGAFFSEIVLDEAGRMTIDLATPDPWSARFRKMKDPQRGTIFQLGQWQESGWVEINSPTVAYIPIDPLPDSPYGRSLVAPAFFTAIFLLGLLHDLRRVIAQQGYPRFDISIDLEKLREGMAVNLRDDPDAIQEWVDKTILQIEQVYEALDPDDAYVHTDPVTLNRPKGTLNSDSLGELGNIIDELTRMATRALKSMALLMVIGESSSETHANRQWEVHIAGIKSMQHLLEALLENLFTVALRAQGIQSDVRFRFAELRASELLRDAQAEAMQLANILTKEDAGYISHEEAGMEATGHPPTGEKAATLQVPVPEIVEGDGDGEEPEQSEEDSGNDRTKAQKNGHLVTS